jgi:hypothetical protein
MQLPNILPNIDVSPLDADLLDEHGLLKIMPASYYAAIPQGILAVFCHHHGIYCLPTTEFIEWLRPHVVPGKTIEIGAGVGATGRALGIPLTDSCYMKNVPEVFAYYSVMGQPITEYPADVEEIDAVEAIKKYQPEVVIGCWITHRYDPAHREREGNMYGVDEYYVLKNARKYIMVGNEGVHSIKPLLELPHVEYRPEWLYSRSISGTPNVIYVWENR